MPHSRTHSESYLLKPKQRHACQNICSTPLATHHPSQPASFSTKERHLLNRLHEICHLLWSTRSTNSCNFSLNACDVTVSSRFSTFTPPNFTHRLRWLRHQGLARNIRSPMGCQQERGCVSRPRRMGCTRKCASPTAATAPVPAVAAPDAVPTAV